MSNPKRLLDGGTPFERALLSSSRLDVGSLEGQKATLAAIGTAMPLPASPPQAGHAAGAPGGTPATGLGAGALGAAAKWTGIVLVIAGVATGAGRRFGARKDPLPVTIPVVVTQTSSPGGDAQRSAALAGDVPATSVRSTLEHPTIRSRHSAPSSAGAVGQVASLPLKPAKPGPAAADPYPSAALGAAVPPGLDLEIRALDGVRASLRGHDAQGALDRLDRFDASFPEALLADEAAVLRIDALVLKGDRPGAAALSRRFLASNPASAHAPHLRALLSSDVQNP
jgi:hypothetical protein